MKKAAAEAAIEYVEDGSVVGVGTGSTADFFIAALGKIKHRIDGAVASSEGTANKLKALGIAVYDLNSVKDIPVYVDGADEITPHLAMVKGGGGALTREKIVAAVARKFICIAQHIHQFGLIGNADEFARHRSDDFFACQRAAAAFDHRQMRRDFIGAVDVERQVFHTVQIVNRDAQGLQFRCRAVGAGHCAVDAMLDFAQRSDEKIRGRAGADADHAAVFDIANRGLGGRLFHVSLVHGRMIIFSVGAVQCAPC